jgi:hypothetical protein
LRSDQKRLSCPNCAAAQDLDPAGWSRAEPDQIRQCLVCGCRHLYRQRDLNRALGCLLVAVGAALVPWTYGLSLVLLAVVDLALYYRLPEAVVCYRCDTVFRDARPTPRQAPFDLLKHDVLKFGKSWAEPEDGDAGKPGSVQLSSDAGDDSR